MDKKKLDELEEATDRILRLSELLRVDSPVQRKRADAILADARMMQALVAQLKSED